MTYSKSSSPNLSKTVAADGNQFATDLYARLCSEKGNLFLSPYSIRSALAMTYAGAKGETAKQMSAVLHFSTADNELHRGFRLLSGILNDIGVKPEHRLFELVVANALWLQNGYPFRKTFLDLVADNYAAGVHNADFAAATESARLKINEWVAKQTKDKIKDLIASGAIPPNTRLILTNAIYFKSHWSDSFKTFNTQSQDFRIDAKTTAPIDLMQMRHHFGYFQNADLQAVELPYEGDQLSMVVLLPRNADDLFAFEKSLTSQNLDGWISQLQSTDVQLFLPKFKATSQFQLSTTLKTMGMADAFDLNHADFTGMVEASAGPREPLAIGEVIHKAFVSVDEEGTEAAAATAVMMAGSAAPMRQPSEPMLFRADHPFVYLIRHRESGAILFIGRLSDPRQS